MIIELLSRRAEMFEFEFDEALFALKYKRPAFEPLFQLPPTYRTCQPEDEFALEAKRTATAQTVPFSFKIYALQSAGGCDPRSPTGGCARLRLAQETRGDVRVRARRGVARIEAQKTRIRTVAPAAADAQNAPAGGRARIIRNVRRFRTARRFRNQ